MRQDAADDGYLFRQGPAPGLGKIAFARLAAGLRAVRAPAERGAVPEQVDAFTQMIMTAPPTEEQQKDLDFLLTLGQLFTQVVYAQLIWSRGAGIDAGQARPGRSATCPDLTEAHIDRIFAVFVQDMSEQAVALHGQASATDASAGRCLGFDPGAPHRRCRRERFRRGGVGAVRLLRDAAVGQGGDVVLRQLSCRFSAWRPFGRWSMLAIRN